MYIIYQKHEAINLGIYENLSTQKNTNYNHYTTTTTLCIVLQVPTELPSPLSQGSTNIQSKRLQSVETLNG